MPIRPALLITLCVTATPSPAQAPAIVLPDTLGARVSDAGTGLSTDYDRLIGSWQFRFQSSMRSAPGKPPVLRPATPGTWTFRRSHDGGMISDDFRLDLGGATATFRIFDPAAGRWAIQGTDVGSGQWEAGETWRDGDDLLVIQRSGPGGIRIMRARYRFLSPDRFVWRADLSRDGGKTWTRDAMRLEAERAPAPDDEPTEASLLAAREAVWRDFFANAPDLAPALADDFVAIEAGNPTWADRASVLAQAKASAEGGTRLVALEFPANRIERDGPIAIIHSRYRAELDGPRGRNRMAGQVTEVFRWNGRRWIHTSWHLDFER